MSGNTEKRMVADTGYEVRHSIHIGDREILVAENMEEPDGKHYMKAEYSENGVIGQYDRVICSPCYLSIMEEFLGGIDRQIVGLKDELKNSDFQREPVGAEQCYPNDNGVDITGEVVAIKASALRPEYRRGDAQLVFVTHGDGALANPRNSGVYCFHLNDGKQARYERHQVQGRIKQVPLWARAQLEIYEALREIDGPERTEAEKVGNYRKYAESERSYLTKGVGRRLRERSHAR